MAKEDLNLAQVQESVQSPFMSGELTPDKDVESKLQESFHPPSRTEKITLDKDVEGRNIKLSEDLKELNSKFLMLDSKLIEVSLLILVCLNI